MVGDFAIFVLLFLLPAVPIAVAGCVIGNVVRRARRWERVAEGGDPSAHVVLAKARTRAIRRLAIGTLGLISTLEIDEYFLAFVCVVLAVHGLADHVCASSAAREVAYQPSARVVGQRG